MMKSGFVALAVSILMKLWSLLVNVLDIIFICVIHHGRKHCLILVKAFVLVVQVHASNLLGIGCSADDGHILVWDLSKLEDQEPVAVQWLSCPSDQRFVFETEEDEEQYASSVIIEWSVSLQILFSKLYKTDIASFLQKTGLCLAAAQENVINLWRASACVFHSWYSVCNLTSLLLLCYLLVSRPLLDIQPHLVCCMAWEYHRDVLIVGRFDGSLGSLFVAATSHGITVNRVEHDCPRRESSKSWLPQLGL